MGTQHTGGQQSRRSVEERRVQLIDAAIDVLARDGIGAATTRRITDEAGLALGAFHYAFASKDELLHAVIDRFSTGIESVLQDAILAPNASLEDLGDQLIRGYWRFVEETPQLQLAQYELTVYALRDPGLRPLAELQLRRMTEAVELVLEDHPLVPAGEVRHDLASYLAAVLHGLILSRVIENDPAAAQRRLELLLGTLPALVHDATDQGPHEAVATG